MNDKTLTALRVAHALRDLACILRREDAPALDFVPTPKLDELADAIEAAHPFDMPTEEEKQYLFEQLMKDHSEMTDKDYARSLFSDMQHYEMREAIDYNKAADAEAEEELNSPEAFRSNAT